MDKYTIYEVVRDKSYADVKYKKKGREFMPFRADRTHIVLHDKSKDEFLLYNKFTGIRVPNYFGSTPMLGFKPDIKEKSILMKSLSDRGLCGMSFLSERDCDFTNDYPDLMTKCVEEHKKRFKHG